MAYIRKIVEIAANPELVYDLICDVEKFPRYSDVIKEVKKSDPDTFYWKAHINGMWFEWTSVFVDKERPQHISWRSISGMVNHGDYVLSAIPRGTKVSFTMEYHLPSHMIETVLQPVFSPLIEKTFAEILLNIKKGIEEKNTAYSRPNNT